MRRLLSLHQDQEGTISIVTVFTVLLLTMILGMVMNVGREVDGKIRLQNAADAAAYSGGVVIARGMNTLAFTNHLLCEICGMAGFMREARDRNAEKYVPSILAAWDRMAPDFSNSKYSKLRALVTAIPQKTPLEQDLVSAFSDWGEALSEEMLPFLEVVLEEELIPQYQRAVVNTYPAIAQVAAKEAAHRNSGRNRGRGEILGVLWRTSGILVGHESELGNRALPVVDPLLDMRVDQMEYEDWAKKHRRKYSRIHLDQWNNRTLLFFDHHGKMSQFANLWRTFSHGYRNQLLDEYPTANLPHVIQRLPANSDYNAFLDEHFTFVAVVYWRATPRLLPGLFHNPTGADAVAFAQVRVLIPTRRLVWLYSGPSTSTDMGGPGDFPDLLSDDSTPDTESSAGRWGIGREPWPERRSEAEPVESPDRPERWDEYLFNQHWTAQLVPATAGNLPMILQIEPTVPPFAQEGYRLPRLHGLGTEDIGRISTH